MNQPVDKSSQEYVEKLASELYYGLKDRHINLKQLCRKLQAENKNLIHRLIDLENNNIALREELRNSNKDIALSKKYQDVCTERNKWKKLYTNTVKFKKQ